MSLDQYISLAASTGTLLAAIATLFVVLEMARQRRASYRPDLLLSGFSFSAHGKDTSRAETYSGWEVTDAQDTSDKPSLGPFELIRIMNVGLGTAKDVRLTWSCDFERMIRLLNRLAEEAELPERWELRDGKIFYKDRKVSFAMEMTEILEPIPPATIDKAPRYIHIPSIYTLAYATAVYAFAHGSHSEKEVDYVDVFLDEMPPLKLSVAYDDPGDRRHHVAHNVRVVIYSANKAGFKGQILTWLTKQNAHSAARSPLQPIRE
jgi:hypothetical protein